MTINLCDAREGNKVILSNGSQRVIKSDPKVILDDHHMEIELDLGLGNIKRFTKNGLAYGDFSNIIKIISCDEIESCNIATVDQIKSGTDDEAKLFEANKIIDAVLEQRGLKYGTFKSNSETSQMIKGAIAYATGMNSSSFESYHIEALEMIAHKMSRIVNGDPNYLDSWVDIIGYAQLAIDLIKESDQ